MKAIAILPLFDPSAAHHAHDLCIMITKRSNGAVERFALMPRTSVASWLNKNQYPVEHFAILLCGICIFGEVIGAAIDAELPKDIGILPPGSTTVN